MMTLVCQILRAPCVLSLVGLNVPEYTSSMIMYGPFQVGVRFPYIVPFLVASIFVGTKSPSFKAS